MSDLVKSVIQELVVSFKAITKIIFIFFKSKNIS